MIGLYYFQKKVWEKVCSRSFSENKQNEQSGRKHLFVLIFLFLFYQEKRKETKKVFHN